MSNNNAGSKSNGAAGASQAERVIVGDNDGHIITGVDTEEPEVTVSPMGRPVKKVGFIVNDTIESAIKQAHDTMRLLTVKYNVKVVESHSVSPEKRVSWTEKDGLDLIFTFGGDGTILRAA